jgi:hypothetical protein
MKRKKNLQHDKSLEEDYDLRKQEPFEGVFFKVNFSLLLANIKANPICNSRLAKKI